MNIRQDQHALPFPTAEPEALGIPSQAILDFLRALSQHEYRLHALMLMRHGKLSFASAAAPYTLHTPHRVFSVGKSILALSLYFALQEGKLSLDESIAPYFPEYLSADHPLCALTVRDLLTMRSGQASDPFPAILDDLDTDLFRLFFQTPLTEAPGTLFRYNNTIPHIVYALVERATGVPFQTYQWERLCQPLDAPLFALTNSQGQYNPVPMSMSAVTLMKFAQFYLQEGVWEGQSLLDAAYIREATKLQTTTGQAGNFAEYGLQIWRNAFGGYRMDGGWGQYAIVLPHEDLAAVILSDMPDSAFALTAFEQQLLPQLKPAPLPPNPTTYATLQTVAQSMTLAPQEGHAASPRQMEWFDRWYWIAERKQHVRFTAAGEELLLTFQTDSQVEVFHCGLQGQWISNPQHMLVTPERTVDNGVFDMDSDACLLTGAWQADHCLEIASKSLGAMGEYLYRFTFTTQGFTLHYPSRVCRGGPNLQDAVCLHAERSESFDD